MLQRTTLLAKDLTNVFSVSKFHLFSQVVLRATLGGGTQVEEARWRVSQTGGWRAG